MINYSYDFVFMFVIFLWSVPYCVYSRSTLELFSQNWNEGFNSDIGIWVFPSGNMDHPKTCVVKWFRCLLISQK